MNQHYRKAPSAMRVLFIVFSLGFHSSAAQVPLTDRAAARFLEQATWGPSSESIEKVKQMGISAWLDWQFSLPASILPEQPILDVNGNPYTDHRQLQNEFMINAISRQDQLRQRVAFALSKIWVVSSAQFGYCYWIPSYWKLLSDGAFGNYRNIIYSLSRNSAMGFYQNIANNRKAVPELDIRPNENYARELMQLFTIGLWKLRMDGIPFLDSNQQHIPSFTEQDVKEISRVLTGWTYPPMPGRVSEYPNPQYYIGQMVAFEHWHDSLIKQLFGSVIYPPGQTADQDLQTTVDALMQHNTMAPFVSKQLIQHLVTSNPSPEYVNRVSSVFLNNGSGIRGDLKAVIRAILTDQEARAGDTEANSTRSSYGRLRDPVQFVAGLARGLSLTPISSDGGIYWFARKIGQDVFRAPSVFGYFSPQYKLHNGLFGPEFEIYHDTHAVNRLNVVLWLLTEAFDNRSWVFVEPTRLKTFERDVEGMINEANRLLLHSSMSPKLRQAAVNAAGASSSRSGALQNALYIILTSSEYQVVR